MTIKILYDNKHKILTGKVTGYLVAEDYEKIIVKIIASKEYPSDVNILWDLNEMEFDNIDINFQKKLLAARQLINKKRGTAKVALVSVNNLADPIIKLYTIFSEELNQVVKIFRTIDEAQLWLYSSDIKNKKSSQLHKM